MYASLIAAGVMGAANAINGVQSRKKQRARLREQRDRDLALMDLQYTQVMQEANKNADKQDWRSTMNEGFAASKANNQLAMLDANMEAEGLEFNAEAMGAGIQKGNSLVQAAASGTRNSSMDTAIDLESAVNAAQLQAKENAAYASDNYNINSILNQFNSDVFNIQNDRTDAYDLRHSYDVGGSNWNIYAMKRHDAKKKYDNQIDDLKTNFWSVLSDFGSGASQGFSMGSSIEGYVDDLTGYLKTTGSGNSVMSFDNITHSNNYLNNNLVKLNQYDIFSW